MRYSSLVWMFCGFCLFLFSCSVLSSSYIKKDNFFLETFRTIELSNVHSALNCVI